MQTVPGSISLPVTLILVINTFLTPEAFQKLYQCTNPVSRQSGCTTGNMQDLTAFGCFVLLVLYFFFILSQPAMSLWFCDLQTLTQFTTLPILGYKCCGCKTTSLHFKSAQLTAKGIWASLYIIHSQFYS